MRGEVYNKLILWYIVLFYYRMYEFNARTKKLEPKPEYKVILLGN